MITSFKTPISRQNDVGTMLALLLTGLTIAYPSFRGGYLTYLDNPVHIAEIFSLAHDVGTAWSEVSYLGYPLGILHSPLWYGGMGLLVQIGLPLNQLYALMILIGFMSPVLVLYFIARRHMRPALAFIASYLLLAQQTAITGLGSAFGGMWTFYIAAAAFLLLIDRIGNITYSRANDFLIAFLVAIIGLTHLFFLVPLLILTAIHLIRITIRSNGIEKSSMRQPGAASLGIVASAVYWAPNLISWNHALIQPQSLSTGMTTVRLFFPAPIIGLLSDLIPPLTTVFFITALPMMMLIGFGLVGIFFRKRITVSDAPLYGMLLAGIFFFLLTVISPNFDAIFLGPLSWRMLYIVRMGLALSMMNFLAFLAPRIEKWIHPAACIALGVASVFLALYWRIPLSRETPLPSHYEMVEVRKVWSWLRNNRSEKWGRVYLQDTFMTPPPYRKLVHSHILALTAMETGVFQVGASYGIAPFRTVKWTLSEFGAIYGKRGTDATDRQNLPWLMKRTNATHIVTSNPVREKKILKTKDFDLVFREGRFAVMRLKNYRSRWSQPIEPDHARNSSVDNRLGHIVTKYETGRILLDFSSRHIKGNLLLKSAYHPFWHFRDANGLELAATDDGLMMIRGLTGKEKKIEILYTLPKWPLTLSIAGWFGIALLGIGTIRRNGFSWTRDDRRD